MHGLTALGLRGLGARKLRTTLTTLGVGLGVAVLFAGLATEAGMSTSMDRTVAARIGATDIRVSALGEAGLTATTQAAIAATPGVGIVAPELERRTYLGGPTATGALPAPVTVLGIDPVADGRLHPPALAAGRALVAGDADAVLITERLATDDDLTLGSTIELQGAGAPANVTVVGILAGDGPLGSGAARAVVTPLTVVSAVFPGTDPTRVDLGVAPGTDPATVIAGLERTITSQPFIASRPADLAASLRASTADVTAMASLIGAIALFVGAFLVFNALSMSVGERIRELGLLRAAGATRAQVRRFVLVQALVIGALGSVLGVALGAGLARVVAVALGSVGGVSLEPPPFAIPAAVEALALGITVALAAALEPAWRAARIPPVEALRPRQDLGALTRARTRWLIVVSVVIVVAGLVMWPREAGAAAALRSLVVYGILLAAALALPLLVPVLARLGGLPFRPTLAIEERLARAMLVRDRSRATLTVGALGIGLALVVALSSVGQGARAIAGSWVTDVVPGDVLVTSVRPIAADEGVAADLAAVPGVARISPIATFTVDLRGVATDASAMTGADLSADGRLTFAAGDRDSALAALDRGGAAIVPRAMADRLGIALDDQLVLTGDDGGRVPVRVVGIADRTLPGASGETLLLGWADATTRLGVTGADAFAARFAPGADSSSVRAALDEAASLDALQVVSLGQLRGAIDDTLARVFDLFDALSLVAVVVAALGIANALTMNVVERVREIGILRAAGMTRRQVWRSVVVEAGVVGLAGASVGVVVGLVVGSVMRWLAGGGPDLALVVPWPTVGLAVVLGVVVSMLAAAYPAGLAARVSIVRAVSYE